MDDRDLTQILVDERRLRELLADRAREFRGAAADPRACSSDPGGAGGGGAMDVEAAPPAPDGRMDVEPMPPAAHRLGPHVVQAAAEAKDDAESARGTSVCTVFLMIMGSGLERAGSGTRFLFGRGAKWARRGGVFVRSRSPRSGVGGAFCACGRTGDGDSSAKASSARFTPVMREPGACDEATGRLRRVPRRRRGHARRRGAARRRGRDAAPRRVSFAPPRPARGPGWPWGHCSSASSGSAVRCGRAAS